MEKKEKNKQKNNKIKGVAKNTSLLAKLYTLKHRVKPYTPKSKNEKVVIIPSAHVDEGKGNGYAAYKGAPEGAEIVVGYVNQIAKNTENKRQVQRQNSKNKKNEPKKEEKDHNPLVLIPVVLLVGTLGLGLHSCEATQESVQVVNQPVNLIIYNVDDPSIATTANTAQANQENATNSMYYGEEFDYDRAVDTETKASSNSEKYQDLSEEIKEVAPNLTEDFEGNASKILDNLEEMYNIYEDKASLIDEAEKAFEEEVKKYPDSRTNAEIEVAQSTNDKFHEDENILNTNKEELGDLYKESQKDNVEVNIDSVEQQLDGDIEITGEKITTLVKHQKIHGLRAVWENIKNFFRGDKENQR